MFSLVPKGQREEGRSLPSVSACCTAPTSHRERKRDRDRVSETEDGPHEAVQPAALAAGDG